MTPGRAALGTLLGWAYWLTGLLLLSPLAVDALAPLLGGSIWAGVGEGAALAAVLFGGEVWFGRRMADRAYGLFAALARDWGVLSGRIPAEATEEQ